MSIFVQFVICAAGVFGFTASEFHIALLCGLCDDFLSLLQSQTMSERVTVRSAHIVHADGGNGFHARINLGGTDNKAPTAADAQNTDPLPVNKRLGAQEIDRSAEILGIHIR
jgi:hypothetical protein